MYDLTNFQDIYMLVTFVEMLRSKSSTRALSPIRIEGNEKFVRAIIHTCAKR